VALPNDDPIHPPQFAVASPQHVNIWFRHGVFVETAKEKCNGCEANGWTE